MHQFHIFQKAKIRQRTLPKPWYSKTAALLYFFPWTNTIFAWPWLLSHGCLATFAVIRPYTVLYWFIINLCYRTYNFLRQFFQKSWTILLRPLSSKQWTLNSLKTWSFPTQWSHFQNIHSTSPPTCTFTGLIEDRGKIFLYLRGHAWITFYLDWGFIIQSPQLLSSNYTVKNLFVTCLSYCDRSHLAWQVSFYLYIFCPMRHNLINKSFFPSFWAINLYYTSGTKDWWMF